MVYKSKHQMTLKSSKLLAAPILCFWLAAGSSFAVAASLERAKAYQEANEIRSAVIELKNLLQEDAENAEARLLLGQVYLDSGDAAAAEKELVRASELGITGEEITLLIARSRLQQGNFEAVIADIIPDDFKESTNSSEAYALQGQAYLGKQQIADARDMFNRAVEINNNDRGALGLARIAFLEGEKESALAQLDKLLERSPEDLEALFTKGQVQASLEQYDEASETFTKVIAVQNDNILGLIARSEVYLRLGKLKLARADADAVLKINPNVPQAHFIIARLQLQAGEYEQAQLSGEQVLRLAPQHFPSFFIVGSANYALSNFEQAQFYLEKFVSAQPSHLIGARVLGATYLSLKQPALAIELLEPLDQSMELQDAQILNVLGGAYLQTGDFEKGTETLNRAIAIQPNLSGARTQIALAELAGGDLDGAIGQLQAAESQDDSSPIGNVMLILSYLKKQDYANANKTLASAIKKYPDSGVFYNLKGAMLDNQGNTVEAKAAYEKALEVEPKYVPAMMSLAKQEVLGGNFPAAKKIYEKALKTQPGHLQAQLAMAQLTLNEGDTAAHIDWLEKAWETNPKVITPVVYLVDYYVRTNNLDRALNEARKFQSENSKSDQAFSLLARVQLARNELADAKYNLRSVIDKNPRDVAHRYKLAEVLVSENAHEEAVEVLEEILALHADNLAALGLKAKAYINAKEIVKAEETIKQIEEAHPESVGDEQLRGDLLMAMSKPEQALAHYQKAYASEKDGYLVNAMLTIYRQQGQLDETATLLRDYLQSNPGDNLNRLRLATSLQQLGQNTGAIEQYELIVESVSDNFVVLNNLAWLYWQEGNDKALETAAAAYELMPERPEVVDTYGWIMLHTGDKKRALKLIQSAASRAPTNPEILYHRAKALSENGEKEEAAKELRRVLRDYPEFSESVAANALLAELEKIN